MNPSDDPDPGQLANAARAQRICAVLFDATGTLFDTKESVGSVYARIAIAHGVELPAWRLDDAWKRIISGAPPRVFPDCDADETREREEGWWSAVVRSTFLAADSTVRFADPTAFFRELFDYYKGADAWLLRPEASEGLRELKRTGFATGVVSNFDQRLPGILQALGVHDLLDVIMIPARCGFEKPDPGIFKAALRELELPADAAIFVGDDAEKDRAAAEAVGMQSLDPEILDGLHSVNLHIQRMNDKQPPSRTEQAR